MRYNQGHPPRPVSFHPPRPVAFGPEPQPLDRLPQELFLARLVDASVDGIFAFDRACRYTEWNQAMERLSGKKRDEVLGKNAFDVFPFLREIGEDICFFAALGGESSFSDNQAFTPPETGRPGFFRDYYAPLFNDQNEIVGGIAIVHDVTERKSEEEAQVASQRMTFHVENSPLAVVEWDSDFRVSRWSEAAERVFGWEAEEVLGKHVGDWHFVFDEDVDAVARVTQRQRVGEELHGVLHNRNYRKSGEVLYCEWYNSVMHDANRNLVSVLSLVLDVTARKLAEEERAALLVRERDARRQAEEADRLKDEFLATLSHELRTPLTSILGWATLIRNGEVEEGNFDRAIETIERNARSQARLIDDLLDVSRIITGNLRLDIRPINIAPVVEAARDGLRPTAEAKRIALETEFPADTCLVRGDPNRLRQVIWNLVLNAIKFTPRGGRVTISVKCFEPYVRLTVSDTGDGILPEFLPYVFDRFRQAEGSVTRKQGGLGLGLAVVRHLVELHGGYVSAESGGKGQGATFTVDLPLADDRRDPARAEDRRLEVERRRGPVAGTDESTPTLTGLHVLLVEDDDDSRRLLAMMLKRHGAEVTSASSSPEALRAFGDSAVGADSGNARGSSPTESPALGSKRRKAFRKRVRGRNARDGSRDRVEASVPSPSDIGPIVTNRAPDILISDIGMPDVDGYELLRTVRALPAEQGGLIPAIALTGYATRKDRERALAAGYQLHLAKPVEPSDLISAISSLIRR